MFKIIIYLHFDVRKRNCVACFCLILFSLICRWFFRQISLIKSRYNITNFEVISYLVWCELDRCVKTVVELKLSDKQSRDNTDFWIIWNKKSNNDFDCLIWSFELIVRLRVIDDRSQQKYIKSSKYDISKFWSKFWISIWYYDCENFSVNSQQSVHYFYDSIFSEISRLFWNNDWFFWKFTNNC